MSKKIGATNLKLFFEALILLCFLKTVLSNTKKVIFWQKNKIKIVKTHVKKEL